MKGTVADDLLSYGMKSTLTLFGHGHKTMSRNDVFEKCVAFVLSQQPNDSISTRRGTHLRTPIYYNQYLDWQRDRR